MYICRTSDFVPWKKMNSHIMVLAISGFWMAQTISRHRRLCDLRWFYINERTDTCFTYEESKESHNSHPDRRCRILSAVFKQEVKLQIQWSWYRQTNNSVRVGWLTKRNTYLWFSEPHIKSSGDENHLDTFLCALEARSSKRTNWCIAQHFYETLGWGHGTVV